MGIEGIGFVIGLIGAIWMKKLDQFDARGSRTA